MCHGASRAPDSEYAMLGVPVRSCVVLVLGVGEELSWKSLRTDLEREPAVSCGHEALWHEPPHAEREQQERRNQIPCNAMRGTGSHSPLQSVLSLRLRSILHHRGGSLSLMVPVSA